MTSSQPSNRESSLVITRGIRGFTMVCHTSVVFGVEMGMHLAVV